LVEFFEIRNFVPIKAPPNPVGDLRRCQLRVKSDGEAIADQK
jgi:hypothetical protein